MLAISNISSISIISIITLFICWLSSTITGVYTSSQYQSQYSARGIGHATSGLYGRPLPIEFPNDMVEHHVWMCQAYIIGAIEIYWNWWFIPTVFAVKTMKISWCHLNISCFFSNMLEAWGACFNFLDLGDQFQISQFFRPKSSNSQAAEPWACRLWCRLWCCRWRPCGLRTSSSSRPWGDWFFLVAQTLKQPRGGGVRGDLSMKNADSTTQKLDFTMKHGDFRTKRGDWMGYEWEYHGNRSFGSENRVYWLPKWPFFKGENLKTMIRLRVAMGSLFSDTPICWVGEFLFSYWYIHYLGNPQIHKLNQIHIYLGRYCFWPPLSRVTLWIVRSKHDRICGLLRVIVLILPLTWLWKFDFDRKQPRMVDMFFFFTFSQAALQEGCSWGRILTWLGEPCLARFFFLSGRVFDFWEMSQNLLSAQVQAMKFYSSPPKM